MDNLAIVIFSCDKDEDLWPIFNTCLEKYWKNHPKTYLFTKTLSCPYFETINHDYDLSHWTNRYQRR